MVNKACTKFFLIRKNLHKSLIFSILSKNDYLIKFENNGSYRDFAQNTEEIN